MKSFPRVRFSLPDTIDIGYIENYLSRTTTNTENYPNGYPQIQLDREQYEKELAERQRKHLESFRRQKPWQPCMHDQCQNCHGTGISRFGGACIHMISCPCPKCSPTYL